MAPLFTRIHCDYHTHFQSQSSTHSSPKGADHMLQKSGCCLPRFQGRQQNFLTFEAKSATVLAILSQLIKSQSIWSIVATVRQPTRSYRGAAPSLRRRHRRASSWNSKCVIGISSARQSASTALQTVLQKRQGWSKKIRTDMLKCRVSVGNILFDRRLNSLQAWRHHE